MGRQKSALLEAMQTRAWLAAVQKATGESTNAGLDRYLDDVARRVGPPSSRGDRGRPESRWDRYRTGTTPSLTVVAWVDNNACPGTGKVFSVGPFEGSKHVPLWEVFRMETVLLDLVQTLVPSLVDLRTRGAPFLSKLEAVALAAMSRDHWREVQESESSARSNSSGSCSQCHAVTLEKLTAALGMWRLSHDLDDGMAETERLVRHLLAYEGQNLLRSYELHDLLPLAFVQIEAADLLRRGSYADAAKLLRLVEQSSK